MAPPISQHLTKPCLTCGWTAPEKSACAKGIRNTLQYSIAVVVHRYTRSICATVLKTRKRKTTGRREAAVHEEGCIMLFCNALVRRPLLIPPRAFSRRFLSSLSPLCVKDLYVEPTELDCEGKHLFCHKCIYGVLSSEGCTNKCPVCNTKISNKRKSTILKTRCSQGPLWVFFATKALLCTP